MSTAPTRTTTHPTPWALPVASLALGGLLLLPGHPLTYLVGLTTATSLTAAWIADIDHRTGLLPNRWTGPLALAGLIQVLIASVAVSPQSWVTVAAPCLLGSAITTGAYFLLGLRGWVGFGDVKFAAGLGLIVAIPAGWTGLYLLPLAVTLSALARLFRALTGKPHQAQQPHGPALAAAVTVLMIAGCSGFAYLAEQPASLANPTPTGNPSRTRNISELAPHLANVRL